MLVGEDPASCVYVRNKTRACERAGVSSREYRLPADTNQEALLKLIGELNADPTVDGILVQLPLPGQIRASAVIEAIDPGTSTAFTCSLRARSWSAAATKASARARLRAS